MDNLPALLRKFADYSVAYTQWYDDGAVSLHGVLTWAANEIESLRKRIGEDTDGQVRS